MHSAPGLLVVEARGLAVAVLAPAVFLPGALDALRDLPEPAAKRAEGVVAVTMTLGDVVLCRVVSELDADVLLARVTAVAAGQETTLVSLHAVRRLAEHAIADRSRE